jgi:hypothetical protein
MSITDGSLSLSDIDNSPGLLNNNDNVGIKGDHMTRDNLAKFSGITSFLVGLVVLFFYFREILPMTDVYVAKKEFGYYLFYALIAIAGIFILLRGLKRKKGALQALAGLLIIGLPLLFYAVSRSPWDYAPHRLEIIGRSLIPAFFSLMGILALAGIRWSHAVLMSVFSILGLYHLILAVKQIAGAGDAFSSVHTSDILVALAIAVISLIFAFINFKALRGARSLEA